MFLDTMTVINHHFDKYTMYHNTIANALNVIMWISVVPHQVDITTIVKVLGSEGSWVKCPSTPSKIDNHKHNIIGLFCVRLSFRKKGLNRVHHTGTFYVSSNNN